MKGYISNIEEESLSNDNFRRVVYTAKNFQLVVMSLEPGGEIGEETHDVDQFIRIEKGEGKAILDEVAHSISDGYAVIIPAGTTHNILNTGGEQMKIYSLYSPPHHRDAVVHKTKEDAEADSEEFDGKTTESL